MSNRSILITTIFLAVLSPVLAAAARVNDFPTRERVIYVQECMHAHPGPAFEMIAKCSCALDTIAGEVSHEEYSSMTTIAKAMSIGGERGNTIRDAPGLQPQLKRWRSVEADALRACFVVDENGK